MAVTDHYDIWYVDPDEEIAEFPNTWNYNVDKIDAAIYAAQKELDEASAGNEGGTLVARTNSGRSRFETVLVDEAIPTEDDAVTSKEYVDREAAALDDRIDESRRLIGLNDEYLSSALNRVGTLEDEVPALDDRVTTLENDSGGGGGGGDGDGVFDSGVRKVDDLFPGAVMYHPTNSLCTISRFGPMVTLTLATFDFDGTGNVKMGDIPEGFRPPSTLRLDAMAQGDDNIQMAVRGSNNDLYAYGVPDGAGGYTAHIVYRTADPAPTDLPGTEA